MKWIIAILIVLNEVRALIGIWYDWENVSNFVITPELALYIIIPSVMIWAYKRRKSNVQRRDSIR